MTRGRVAAACAAIVAAACSTPSLPPGMDDEVAPSPAQAPAGAAGYEQRLRERALSQGRQGRLADAAVSWEILTVLRPDVREYRDRLSETQHLIDVAVPVRLQRGAQAFKRGEFDAAAAQYLAALALQPDNAQAAEALRDIERERNKRSLVGKLSRVAQTRKPGGDVPGTTTPDRNELEHAAMLATQGEFDDAIALLERHVAADKRNAAACRLLADLYAQKAERQQARDKAATASSLSPSAPTRAGAPTSRCRWPDRR